MENKYLNGKTVLYIDTNLYDYYVDIKKTMEKAGGIVDHISSSFLPYKEAFGVYLSTKHNTKDHYFHKIIKNYKFKNAYDYVWIKPAETIPRFFLEFLREKFPMAIFISYHWHPIQNDNFIYLSEIFNKLFSFDKIDVKMHENIKYLPLFFTDEFYRVRKMKRNLKYDIVYVGNALIQERNAFLSKVKLKCEEQGLRTCYILYASPKVKIKALLNGIYIKNNSYKKMSRNEIAKLFMESRCVIDFSNPKQSGLTMRTFEALGSGTKLITTNRCVSEEPFFHNDCIDIVCSDEPIIRGDFVSNNNFLIPEIIDNYSIHNWCKSFFE
jgi:hypothetical protein